MARRKTDTRYEDPTVLEGLRNKIINGDFDICQYATSQTSSGYGSVDRWLCFNTGSTKTTSRQAHTLGQTNVPGNPAYYCSTVVSTVAGASNQVGMQQRMEGVKTLSGKTVTVSFWAKADASKNIAIEIEQNFGTGGSPSSGVLTAIGLKALTTVWQKFTFTISVPSVSGKVLGSNNNDFFSLIFWFDAGSSLNSRASNLGQQSGTFDISHVSVVEGDATQETDPFSARHLQQELDLCHRYCAVLGGNHNVEYIAAGHANSTTFGLFVIVLPETLRAQPTLTYSAVGDWGITTSAGALTTCTAIAIDQTGIRTIGMKFTVGSAVLVAGNGSLVIANITFNARLTFSAEL